MFNLPSEVVHLHHGFKNKGKNMVKTKKGNRIHWKFSLISCDLVLYYSEETPHIRMANMQTEKHKLTGREQNKPLHWPFFLKLWPWTLEEKGKKVYFFKSYLMYFTRQLSGYYPEELTGFLHFENASYSWKNNGLFNESRCNQKKKNWGNQNASFLQLVLCLIQVAWKTLGNRMVLPGRALTIL